MMRSRKISLLLTSTLAIFFATVVMPGTRAAAQTESILHNFNDSTGDGEQPTSGVISDASGNLYGTTINGGAAFQNQGTVFELTPVNGGGWTETLLHSFSGGTDGVWPIGGLVRDAAGNLYGTTAYGGGNSVEYCGQGGCGTVFELSPAAGGGWTEKVLHRFIHNGKDGIVPYASMVLDSSGNLYGTTLLGGVSDRGAIFELIRKPGGGWSEQILHSFQGNTTDGDEPYSSLIFDAAGNLYGTTTLGGTYNYGTVFELSRKASGQWAQTILHSFNDDARDGFGPAASLIFDAAGNLYGTTFQGGSSKSCVNNQSPTCGTVFELSRKAGGVWLEKVLFDFESSNTTGSNPFGSLVFDAAGNLYGTAYQGGFSGSGTVYKLTRAANGGWTGTTLHLFGIGTDGLAPECGLIFGPNGNLYGTTFSGGPEFDGTVFEITP